ncbi:MAG: diacylglycerol kinase family protein [Tissierellales bacterium]|nr:diacylglycerol kinase family protein [Tissierellales bacterium]MBN2828502.1 diacylglycerol kinase family protein [Tissierellales bacterium]
MKKVLSSFKYAWNGIYYVFKTQRNFRIQLSVFLITLVVGYIFQIKSFEWLIVIFVSSLVLSLEIINTSIENLVDLMVDNFHPYAEKAKDAAAGAVLLSSILAVIIGLIIFCPYLIAKL